MTDEFPKVSSVTASKGINDAEALGMLFKFLAAEQHTMRDHPQLEATNHWGDIYNVCHSLATTNDDRTKLSELKSAGSIKVEEEEYVVAVAAAAASPAAVKVEPAPQLDQTATTQPDIKVKSEVKSEAITPKEEKKAKKADKKVAKEVKRKLKEERRAVKEEKREAKKQKKEKRKSESSAKS